MPFEKFDREALRIKPLEKREHDLHYDIMLNLDDEIPVFQNQALDSIASKIIDARRKDANVTFMMGAHVIRAGVAPFLIELMKKGLVTHFALNGAGAIHDFELARIGATTESVAKYITDGQFGLWQETGLINEAVKKGVKEDLGFGEILGRLIEIQAYKYRKTSLLAAGYRYQVPVTVHVSIGCDIIHEHPNCDGGAIGEASYTDFLIYTRMMQNLEDGVFINFGSAVTGPEVFLKSLAMVRNVASQQNKGIKHFTTAVFDLLPLEDKNVQKEPTKDETNYYFRPWKNILSRPVQDGGQSFYVRGEHRKTIPNLTRGILKKYDD